MISSIYKHTKWVYFRIVLSSNVIVILVPFLVKLMFYVYPCFDCRYLFNGKRIHIHMKDVTRYKVQRDVQNHLS